MELYTIAKIADILKLPESTVRYYRNRHSEYIPFIGHGRKRRYKKEGLEALRIIAEMANRNLTADEINSHLEANLNRTIDASEVTAITTAAEQQQPIIKALADNLNAIADQKKEIQELRDRINRLEEKSSFNLWQKITGRQ